MVPRQDKRYGKNIRKQVPSPLGVLKEKPVTCVGKTDGKVWLEGSQTSNESFAIFSIPLIAANRLNLNVKGAKRLNACMATL